MHNTLPFPFLLSLSIYPLSRRTKSLRTRFTRRFSSSFEQAQIFRPLYPLHTQTLLSSQDASQEHSEMHTFSPSSKKSTPPIVFLFNELELVSLPLPLIPHHHPPPSHSTFLTHPSPLNPPAMPVVKKCSSSFFGLLHSPILLYRRVSGRREGRRRGLRLSPPEQPLLPSLPSRLLQHEASEYRRRELASCSCGCLD